MDMGQQRSVTHEIAEGETVEQPALLTVPGPPPKVAHAAGGRSMDTDLPVRSERAKQVGLAGVARARAALAAAAKRAEAERAVARTAGTAGKAA